MQLHLVRLQTFTQEVLAAKESEMPSFEEAFDTDSLKKFFQNQDSILNTPFTTYTDSPPLYDDFSNLSQDGDSDGAKFQSRIKSYSEDNFPVSLVFNSEIDREVNTMPSFFKHDSYKVEKTDLIPHTAFNIMTNMSNQKAIAEEQKKNILNMNGQFSIDFAKNNSIFGQNKSIKIASALPTMDNFLDDGFSITEDITSLRIRNKKPVFIIERLNKSNTIAKVEKKKIVNPTIKKKKAEKEEEKAVDESKKIEEEGEVKEKKKKSKDSTKPKKEKSPKAN